MKRYLCLFFLLSHLFLTHCLGQDKMAMTYFPALDQQQEWLDSIQQQLASGECDCIILEANAIDMLWVNQFVLGNPRLAKWERDDFSNSILANLESEHYASLAKLIYSHNRESKNKVAVYGFDFSSDPLICVDRSVWYLPQYLQAGMIDSLLTYYYDEECNTNRLAISTHENLKINQKRYKGILGAADWIVWLRFFERKANQSEDVERTLSDDLLFVCHHLQGKKMIIKL